MSDFKRIEKLARFRNSGLSGTADRIKKLEKRVDTHKKVALGKNGQNFKPFSEVLAEQKIDQKEEESQRLAQKKANHVPVGHSGHRLDQGKGKEGRKKIIIKG